MGARSAILTWHSVDDSGSVISTPPTVFRRQIEALAESGIPVVPLDQVWRHPGSVALTFDDGCRNLAEHAFPLLERFHMPSTIFVVTGYCGGMNNWPTQPNGAVPDLPLLSWEHLAALPPETAIGAHTATHPRLTQLTDEDCDREMRECRDEIEQRLARPVRWFAYPYGAVSDRVTAIAAKHFELAAGTSLRFVTNRSSRLNLPRIDMYYFRNRFKIENLFTLAARIYLGGRSVMRDIRGISFDALKTAAR